MIARPMLMVAVLLCVGVAATPAIPGIDERSTTVARYEVRIEPDLATASLVGSETVVLSGVAVGTLTLNRGALTIDAVEHDGQSLPFELDADTVRIALTSQPRDRRLTIRYHGTPRSGMVFVPSREQIYTA